MVGGWDPALTEPVNKCIEQQVPVEKITAELPEPLADLAKRALSHTHSTLDQLAHDVVGAVYLEDRLRPAAFDDDDSALAADFAAFAIDLGVHGAIQHVDKNLVLAFG